MDRFSELTQTVQKHETELLRYASRLLGDRENARDAVQDAFIKYTRLLEKQEKEAIKNVRAWLYKATRNICLDALRSKKRSLEMPLSEEVNNLACKNKAPDDAAKINEEMRMLKTIINNLEPRDREILILKLEHGKSYKEIAEILELSVGNVGFILHNAMKKLKNEFMNSAGIGSKK